MISAEGLTVADFEESGWHFVITEAKAPVCYDYSSRFGRRADAARAAGETKFAVVFSLLEHVTSLCLNEEATEQPFVPMCALGDRRTAIPEDFGDDALDYLARIHPEISDPDLRARVADLLYVRRAVPQMARAAATDYLRAAPPLEASEEWHHQGFLRLRRAEDLAFRLKDRDLTDALLRHVEVSLAAWSCHKASGQPLGWMELLLRRKKGDPALYVALCERMALVCEQAGAWEWAREYWDVKAKWHKRTANDDLARDARIRGAETWISEADAFGCRDGDTKAEALDHLRAAHFVEQAIHSLRKEGAPKERTATLHRRLVDHQRRGTGALGAVAIDLDTPETHELREYAIKQVSGLPWRDALYALATLHDSPSVASLRSSAQIQDSDPLFSEIFGSGVLNEHGRTVATRCPASDVKGDKAKAERLKSVMAEQAVLLREHLVVTLIEPARRQIVREHRLTVSHLAPLIVNSPFVPASGRLLVARGLYAGLYGDWMLATTLLMPQIENGLRRLLLSGGVIPRAPDPNDAASTFGLDVILRQKPYSQALTDILGEDTFFDLYGLLVARFGPNFRNAAMHGLVPSDALLSRPSAYFWWLSLRLCLLVRGVDAIEEDVKTAEPDMAEAGRNGDLAEP
jgi:hypothetical protein